MAPVLIGIDWGSSMLRVALLDAQGVVLERRENAAGVFSVRNGEFAAALWPLCADWAAVFQLPMLACGMIGSRQGIVEVPYLRCPAELGDLAAALGRVDLPPQAAANLNSPQALFIVPGLTCGSQATGWDVMRGEETQFFGAPSGSGQVFVLPGTHSKWIRRGSDGKLESFQTYMTGELYELLQRHSSLAKVMATPQWSADAFRLGVAEARDHALEDLLFRVRTAGLMGRLAASALSDYLSGLLIGAEVKAGLRRFANPESGAPVSVLGSAQLTQRYAMTLDSFGIPAREIAADAVFAGLITIARSAGLIGGQGPQT